MNADHFKDRIAFVTGAASGIGAALVDQLSNRGARVFAADIDAEGVARQAAAANAACGEARITPVALDVTDREAVADRIRTAQREAGRIDLMFNNAGIVAIGNVLRMQDEHWDQQVDVNLRGVYHGVQAAYPLMVTQPILGRGRHACRGHIVNTASIAGLIPSPGFTAYAMTKHAVVGLSVSLRSEAARHDVRVSVVCPGVIDTAMAEHAQLVGRSEHAKDRVSEKRQRSLPDAAYCARHALVGVVRNRAIIPVTPSAHVGWRLWRLWPCLLTPLTNRLRDTLAPVD